MSEGPECRPLDAQELRDWWGEAAFKMSEAGTQVVEHADVFIDLADTMHRALIEEGSVRAGYRRMEAILVELNAGIEQALDTEARIEAMSKADSAIQRMALEAALMMSACLRTIMEGARGNGVTPMAFRPQYIEEVGGQPWVGWYLQGVFGPLTLADMIRPTAPTLTALTEARSRLAFLYASTLMLVDATLVGRTVVPA